MFEFHFLYRIQIYTSPFTDNGPMQNLWKNISTDNLVSGSLMSKTKFLPPQKLLKLKPRLATNVCYIFWHHWHFHSLFRRFSELNPYCYDLIRVRQTNRRTDRYIQTDGRTDILTLAGSTVPRITGFTCTFVSPGGVSTRSQRGIAIVGTITLIII